MMNDYMDDGDILSTIITEYSLDEDLAFEIAEDWAEHDRRVRPFFQETPNGAFITNYYLEEKMKHRLLKQMNVGGFNAIV